MQCAGACGEGNVLDRRADISRPGERIDPFLAVLDACVTFPRRAATVLRVYVQRMRLELAKGMVGAATISGTTVPLRCNGWNLPPPKKTLPP